MSSVRKIVCIAPEEYLEGELVSDIRHEYVGGTIYAMVGASSAHNLIAGNVYTALRMHLRGGPCQTFMVDMKARIADAFYYPDVMVVCDPADRHEYYRERPLLLVEVGSPSTETRDAVEKRLAYQAIPSLREYVLIAQDRIEVRVFRRIAEGWELETCTEGDMVMFRSVDLAIPIGEIYEDVL